MNDSAKDQQRLVISLGIVATAVGVYTIPSGDNVVWVLLRTAITIQAVLAFLYILYLASSLKHNGSGSLFDITMPKKLGMFFYDQSIEMLWATLFPGLLLLLSAVLPNEQRLTWLIIGLVGLTIVAVVITILVKLIKVLRKKTK